MLMECGQQKCKNDANDHGLRGILSGPINHSPPPSQVDNIDQD
jgi:hypothetical protein